MRKKPYLTQETHGLSLRVNLLYLCNDSGATIVGTLKSGLQMLTCGKIRGSHKLVMVTVALSTQAVLLVGLIVLFKALLSLGDAIKHGVECRCEVAKLGAEIVQLRLNSIFRGRKQHGMGNRVGWGSLGVKGEQESGLANRDSIEKPVHGKAILVIMEKGLHGRPVPQYSAIDVIIQLNPATNYNVVSISLIKLCHQWPPPHHIMGQQSEGTQGIRECKKDMVGAVSISSSDIKWREGMLVVEIVKNTNQMVTSRVRILMIQTEYGRPQADPANLRRRYWWYGGLKHVNGYWTSETYYTMMHCKIEIGSDNPNVYCMKICADCEL
ncbi:hypothetical protein EDD15DRAFT_2517637 [Pisolithus albus]|nr:hypothetical protein EDD15DRAFT_2517637 [Pisolithus albus]